jgi:hypothetical protein
MNLKGVQLPYQKLVSQGFNFNAFEYKANVIIKEQTKTTVLKNVLVIDETAIAINKDKTEVFIFKLSENKHAEIHKIDTNSPHQKCSLCNETGINKEYTCNICYGLGEIYNN